MSEAQLELFPAALRLTRIDPEWKIFTRLQAEQPSALSSAFNKPYGLSQRTRGRGTMS